MSLSRIQGSSVGGEQKSQIYKFRRGWWFLINFSIIEIFVHTSNVCEPNLVFNFQKLNMVLEASVWEQEPRCTQQPALLWENLEK
ncbi:hypothetical protein LWI29_021165 [Acer saccharum]|uniref:Uncharacterized protein n=1 Tax=Acer saccharum TaxID=4024 RepID=A0AA39W2U4_ACESA|nr:hypothetical protein LWI29_021165 [Acer saccharum]